MARAIVFEAGRNGYTVGQVTRGAMRVAELIGLLQDMEDDDLVIISHDNGYTYGSLEYLGDQDLDEEDE